MIGAGSSSKAVRRLGTARVVSAGLTGLSILLAVTTLWTPDTSAWALVAWLFGRHTGAGLDHGSRHRGGRGRRPAAKSGVASATNTGADGVGRTRRRDRRLARQLALLERRRRLARRAAGRSAGRRGGLDRRRQRDRRAAASRGEPDLLAATGEAFTNAMGSAFWSPPPSPPPRPCSWRASSRPVSATRGAPCGRGRGGRGAHDLVARQSGAPREEPPRRRLLGVRYFPTHGRGTVPMQRAGSWRDPRAEARRGGASPALEPSGLPTKGGLQ